MCFFIQNSLIPSNWRLKNTAYSVGTFVGGKMERPRVHFVLHVNLEHVIEKIYLSVLIGIVAWFISSIKFMGVLTTFFLFWEGAYWFGPSSIFVNIGHSPIDGPIWTPWPTFSDNIHQSLIVGKPYAINVRCYWEHLGKQLEEPGWEPHGNMREHKLFVTVFGLG